MSEPFGRLRRFLRELKRRKVYRVAAGYLVAAFVVLQVAGLAADAFGFPGWFQPMIWVVAGLGFPLAIVLAWAFEVTPEGVRRTPEAEKEEEKPQDTRRAVQILAALGLIVVAGAGIWQFTPLGGGDRGTDATRPRIAVLPFENIAPDTTEDYFAQGMHEEVLNQLSKVSGLEVISRTSVMQYRGRDKTVREISHELGGVNALLEGTVRRAGDRVRITTQLIEAPEDEQLWSNTYQRRLAVDEIFQIQADIAEQVASALETQLAGEERQQIKSVPTSNLAAYDTYLRGRSQFWQFWGTQDPADLDSAIAGFRDAVRRDSAFAEAHAWLGLAYAWRGVGLTFAESSGGRWIDSAKAAAERAWSLDPELVEAYVAQGRVAFARDSLSKRVEVLRRAVELQPNHAYARAELADALGAQGDYVEAVRAAHEAVRLDPRAPAVHQEMADQLRVVGLYDAAEAWDRRALEAEAGYSEALLGLMRTQRYRGEPKQALQTWQRLRDQRDGPFPIAWVAYLDDATEVALQAGNPAQAKAMLEQLLEVLPDAAPGEPGQSNVRPGDRALLGLTELQLGNRDQGRKLLQKAADSARAYLERDTLSTARYRFTLAAAQAALGETDRALENLERWRETVGDWGWIEAYTESPLLDEPMMHSPLLENLRSEPRFQRIARELQSKKDDARAELLQLGIDLYPPGVEPDSAVSQPQPDD